MLPATARLRRREEFTTTVRQGTRASRGGVALSLATFAPSVGSTPVGPRGPLVGFAVSKAVGGSVVRHRVARRLRHLMRERLSRLPDGSRLVVRALPGAAHRASADLAGDLDAALNRILRR